MTGVVLLLVGGLATLAIGGELLVLGAKWLVDGSVAIARLVGMSELLVGLTVVAAGTSLPEVAASVVASVKGERDIAVGNIVGSNLFNIMCVLGLSAALAPGGVDVSPTALRLDIPIMIAVAVACLPIFFTGHMISRWEGGLFLAYYVAYTAYVILAATNEAVSRTFGGILLGFVTPLTVVTLLVFVARALRADGANRALRLTTAGGDRAIGYVMSNKIARRGGQFVCTWLDVERQNRWALVDLARGEILRTGVIGQRRQDNHCGVALATDTDGTLHALVGAHHGSFVHYRWLPDEADWTPVEDGRAVGESATYPSLVCDGRGTLHVLYRREANGRDAHLVYCRRPRQGPWSEPRLLVRSAVSEHSWLTNAIEVGPSGRLHAVFSNTQLVPGQGPDARYYGAAHVYSDDAGETWQQFGDAHPLVLPAEAGWLQRIEGPSLSSERREARYGGARGPLNSYYHKMVLSNPAVDERGRPWAIVHNLLTGDAQLYRHEASGTWVGTPLADAVHSLLPGYQIRPTTSIACRPRSGSTSPEK